MKPRLGLPSDVEAVANVIINTMPLDPQWNYRFPYRHQYPEDHYKYTKMLFEYFLDPAYDDWLVMVVEDSLEPGGPTKLVAFGVLNVSYINKRRYGPGYTPQDRKSFAHTTLTTMSEVLERGGKSRLDANHERFNEFWKGQIRVYKRLFAPIGPEQTHLQILATLPEFQRRGHGSSLCKWAMELVRKDALKDMTVMASPMGHKLYTWLGFERVATFYIQVPGDEESVVLQAMIYRPAKLQVIAKIEDEDEGCAMI